MKSNRGEKGIGAGLALLPFVRWLRWQRGADETKEVAHGISLAGTDCFVDGTLRANLCRTGRRQEQRSTAGYQGAVCFQNGEFSKTLRFLRILLRSRPNNCSCGFILAQ
jgi:hypothetical protein